MALELHVESYFVKRVEALGGLTFKMTILGRVGVPDRLAILPGGRIIFCELKRPKRGVVAKVQTEMIKRLRGLGCEVWLLKNKDEIDAAFKSFNG